MIVKAVNHASVLIQEGDNFILTDPWYEQPAFGSWLPVPPTSIHPVYLLALAKDNPKFKILISHGHDDHLDDEWLSLFPKDVSNQRFYFVHSYYVELTSKDDSITTTQYGIDFVSALAKKNIFGVQFHPEKSHRFGKKLLKNFCEI